MQYSVIIKYSIVEQTTKMKFGECGIRYSGPVAWNCLPLHLQTVTQTNISKQHLEIISVHRLILLVLLALLGKLYSSTVYSY